MKQIIFSAIGILGLCIAVGFGFYIEMFCLQVPCILCLLQRAAMLLIAIGLYWNILYGVVVSHYAFCFLATLFGLLCSLRHMALNVCKPIQETTFFFCTYRLYTWSFLTFIISFFSLILLLFAYRSTKERAPYWMKVVFGGLLGTVISICAISSLYHRGFSF